MPQQFTVEYLKQRVNQIWNPSFESGIVDGTAFNTNADVITGYGVEGQMALRLTATTTSSNAYYETPLYTSRVRAGSQYRAGTYIRLFTGSARTAKIGLVFYTRQGVYISETPSNNITLALGWTFATVALTTAPANAYYATIRVWQVSGFVVGNETLVDAQILEESPPVSFDFFDGSTDPYGTTYYTYWLGAANNSPSAITTNIWTQLNDVQQISGFIGKQELVNDTEPSRMTISARYPTGFDMPNTALRVGTVVRVKRTGSANVMWQGFIRNVNVEYGIPFNTSTYTGVADYLTIECEGALAKWGRQEGNGFTLSATTLKVAIETTISAQFNIQAYVDLGTSGDPPLSTSTVDNSCLNWLNTACNTVGANIRDGIAQGIFPEVNVTARDYSFPAGSVVFRDYDPDATGQIYDSIVFDSVSSDYFTQIELNTTGYGDVVVNTGVAPYRTLRQETFSASASQASDLANYLLGIYGDNGFGIAEISCKSEAQTVWNLDLGVAWAEIIGRVTFVFFRNSIYRCTIMGCAFTATPSESRFTYYLADIGLTPYLVLNDAYAGILDTNKLGW